MNILDNYHSWNCCSDRSCIFQNYQSRPSKIRFHCRFQLGKYSATLDAKPAYQHIVFVY